MSKNRGWWYYIRRKNIISISRKHYDPTLPLNSTILNVLCVCECLCVCLCLCFCIFLLSVLLQSLLKLIFLALKRYILQNLYNSTHSKKIEAMFILHWILFCIIFHCLKFILNYIQNMIVKTMLKISCHLFMFENISPLVTLKRFF